MKKLCNQIIENFNGNTKLEVNHINDSDFLNKPIFILSLPRVGSTFLQQILLSFSDIGYISNLLASFWNNPEIGAALHKKFYDKSYVSNFRSSYGNTFGAYEPHEWGFFWRKWLDISDDNIYFNPKSKINWINLRKKILIIEKILNKPLFFNTPYANNYFKEINSNLTNSKVIFLFRNPYSICSSILNARMSRYGTLNSFFGAKPKDYSLIKNLSNPIEQVVAQVFFIYNDLLDLKSNLSIDSNITIKYESIIDDFNITIKKILSFSLENYDNLIKKNKIPLFENRNKIELFDSKFNKDLDKFFIKYFKNFDYHKI